MDSMLHVFGAIYFARLHCGKRQAMCHVCACGFFFTASATFQHAMRVLIMCHSDISDGGLLCLPLQERASCGFHQINVLVIDRH